MGEAEAEKEVENIMSTVDTNNSGFIDYSGRNNKFALQPFNIQFINLSTF